MTIYKQYANARWMTGEPGATWRVHSASGHLWCHKWPVTFCRVDGATIYKYIFYFVYKVKIILIAFVNRNCAKLALGSLFWRTLQLPFKCKIPVTAGQQDLCCSVAAIWSALAKMSNEYLTVIYIYDICCFI